MKPKPKSEMDDAIQRARAILLSILPEAAETIWKHLLTTLDVKLARALVRRLPDQDGRECWLLGRAALNLQHLGRDDVVTLAKCIVSSTPAELRAIRREKQQRANQQVHSTSP